MMIFVFFARSATYFNSSIPVAAIVDPLNKELTAEQLDQLKASIRQRFDDLYHRIGTSRQKLATTVLLVDQSINKEFAKEKIDSLREKQILNKVREIEREANNQLPHVLKISSPKPSVTQPSAVKAPAAKVKAPLAEAKTPPVKAKTPPAKVKTPPAKAKAPTIKAKTATKGKAKKK